MDERGEVHIARAASDQFGEVLVNACIFRLFLIDENRAVIDAFLAVAVKK